VSSISYPHIYLESIFLNLLSNAIKYSSNDRRPEISFRTFNEGDKVILECSDNGLGIDLNRYHHQIFKMRKTFHANTESRGIGLFLIRNQIEAMGGQITVKSELNQGSTFTIIFNKFTPQR
jgi:signal transduction histidine kinase